MYSDNFDELEFFITPDGTFRPHQTNLPKPELCPHCSKHIDPIFLSSFFVHSPYIEDIEDADINGTAIASYQCPSCKMLFAEYLKNVRETPEEMIQNKRLFSHISKDSRTHPIVFSWKSFSTSPRTEINLNIPEGVETISKRFIKIYQQSAQAENDNLDEIAGMGYRKAIEILLTDFLLAFPPNDNVKPEWVKNPKTTAANKIAKIENNRIRTTAKAISWIGNDESHYTRVNEEKDIQEMKKFIKLLLTLIEQEIIFSDVEDFTNK